jgi:hypothetical protein
VLGAQLRKLNRHGDLLVYPVPAVQDERKSFDRFTSLLGAALPAGGTPTNRR